MDATTILQEVGLTANEEAVYLALLETPNSTGAALARRLDMDKSSTYRAVDGLVIKGLVKANVRPRGSTYKAEVPEHLVDYFNSQRASLNSKGVMLQDFVEKLKKDLGNARSTSIVIEEGLDAHVKRMEESLSSQEKIIREMFRNHSIFQIPSYISYVKDYAKRRRDSGIFIYQLEQNFAEIHQVFPEIMGDTKYYKKEIRKLPQGMDDNNSLRIYDDVVNIMSYDENDDFIVITIKDKYVAQLMKNMYDLIWSMSEEVIW